MTCPVQIICCADFGDIGVSLLLNRFAYIGIRGYFRNSDNFGKKVVILGYNDVAKKLANYLEQKGST
jgi:putative colanic acid biosynthesis UDP-glucose lipid carrier transferase